MDFMSEVTSVDFDKAQHDSLTCYQFCSQGKNVNDARYCYFPVLIAPEPLTAVLRVSDVFGAQMIDRCIR